jgi:plastocyanin
MRSSQVLACLAAVVASVPEARSDPRPQDRPVTQADLDRLEQKLEAQQRTLDKLLQLNEQYLRQLVGLLSEARSPVPGEPTPATGKPARDEPKPADPRVAVVKPKPAPRPTGTITGKVTGGGGEALVYVDDIVATSRGVAAMNQEGKQFKPRVLAVAKGTRVEFPNHDAVFHNVFSVTPDNSFDLGSYQQGASKSVTMTKPGVVTVYCNLHSQMIGYVLVTPSPLFVQAGEDGSFRLPNVPIGHHRIVAWAPNAKPMTIEVDVTEAEPAALELALKRGRVGPHTNKDGMAYGSYKD